MCPKRLVDIRKLEADRRDNFGFSQISANIAKKNRGLAQNCVVLEPLDQENNKSYEVFKVAISSLDIRDSHSRWYLDSRATRHVLVEIVIALTA